MQNYWRLALILSGIFAQTHVEARTLQPQPVEPIVSTKNILVPVDQESCFSPDEPCVEKLASFIASAQRSIQLAIYDINLESIVKLLINKSEHIPVQIVVDKMQSKGPRSKVKVLFEAGLNIRYGKQKGIMHNKFIIVDDKMLVTGSFNFTNHAKLANQENQIYLANTEIISRYSERFHKIWESSIEVTADELMNEENPASTLRNQL